MSINSFDEVGYINSKLIPDRTLNASFELQTRVNEVRLTTALVDATEIDDAPTSEEPVDEREHAPYFSEALHLRYLRWWERLEVIRRF